MRNEVTIPQQEAVAEAVKKGFSQEPKSLPSWLFYNAEGDQIFQAIMELPEYYPTRCEFEILNNYKHEILPYFISYTNPFKLIELGAGDGTKTQILLTYFLEHGIHFTYTPVDISANVLQQLTTRLTTALPDLVIEPQQGEYNEALQKLNIRNQKKVVLLLGANIGNFAINEAAYFLQKVRKHMTKGDIMMIGFDLKKDPEIILKAYHDSQGVTRNFNLNVLRRLNDELGANFNVSQFQHFPYYDPETGSAKSFLVSMYDQDVSIKSLGRVYHFRAWETIHTEISQKYDLLMIENLLTASGFDITDFFFDKQHYFCNVIATPAR